MKLKKRPRICGIREGGLRDVVVEEGTTASSSTTNDHHGAEVMLWYISSRGEFAAKREIRVNPPSLPSPHR